MSSNAAKKCFAENLALFADSGAEPEKFNLYNGLFNIAEAIQNIEHEIQKLRRDVNNIPHR